MEIVDFTPIDQKETAKFLCSIYKEIGISKIVLDVVRSNIRAIRFYEKSGFRKYN